MIYGMANEEVIVKEKKGTYLGNCCRCGKAIFANEEFRYGKKETNTKRGFFSSSTGDIAYEVDEKKPLGEDLFCKDCVNALHAQEKASLDKDLEGLKRKKKRSLLYGFFFGILFFFIGIVMTTILFANEYREYGFICMPCTVGLGYYAFSLAYSLHAQNTFIERSIESFAKAGFISFPRSIIRNDASAGDVLATKILLVFMLLIIWSVVSIILILLAIIMGVFAMFLWPYSRQKETKEVREKYAKIMLQEE